MPAFQDLTGQKFHRCYLVKSLGLPNRNGHIKWIVLCDCGTFFTAVGTQVKNGNTKSCGCWKREFTGKRRRTHGQSQQRLYKTFHGILKRCYNPNSKSYKNYGGRGIICLWYSFEEFYQAMGECPGPEYMIERKNNDGPYSTENCIWATRKTQANNTRRSRRFTYNGETRPLSEWAHLLGQNYMRLYQRLHNGWTVERAFTTPFILTSSEAAQSRGKYSAAKATHK